MVKTGRRRAYRTIEVNVEDVLCELDDEELIEELESRDPHVNWTAIMREDLHMMWYYYTMGNTEKFEEIFRNFLWNAIGKTI